MKPTLDCNKMSALSVCFAQRPANVTIQSAALVRSGSNGIIVPAMALAEILYLSERGRIAIGLSEVAGFFNRLPMCKEQPLTLGVVQAASEITDIPELHDRLIAGAARYLSLDLVTNDGIIQNSAFVNTLW